MMTFSRRRFPVVGRSSGPGISLLTTLLRREREQPPSQGSPGEE
jgi:hypothetical protein